MDNPACAGNKPGLEIDGFLIEVTIDNKTCAVFRKCPATPAGFPVVLPEENKFRTYVLFADGLCRGFVF
jgi:hypothetical protein